MEKQYCEICNEEALFLCGDCQIAGYCSKQHRGQHWKVHRGQCKVLKSYQQMKVQKQVQLKRLVLRKQYFDTFSNKIYDQALKIVKQLFQFQKSHIQLTRYIQNQFQFGMTVCLLCRTLIILGKLNQARIQITEYLKQKQHFLEDLRDICKFPQIVYNEQNIKQGAKQAKKQATVSQKSKQFLKKKLSLISAVANIFYSLQLPPIQYYTMYLNHIQYVFGPQSFQISNCYFLIGTHYMQTSQFNRSIACFVRAAQIRQSKGGECYYNLGIIYEMRGKLQIGARMYEQAIKLLQEQQGQNSIQVAKIYEDLGQLMIRRKQLNGGIKAFQRALKIYANKNQMEQFQVIKERIKSLHQFIKRILLSDDKSSLPKQLQDLLGDKNKKEPNQNQLKAEDLSFVQQTKRNKDHFNLQNLLKLSEKFLSRLNPLQIFRLSQLQLQLEKCTSEFSVAYTVANSDFIKRLGENRLKEIKQQNQKLFQLMNIQRKIDNLHAWK